MDYLDPKKERAQMIQLLAGYVLIGIAVLFATLILLYQAYGFGIGKGGQVIQNGLIFLSSEPSGARIYLDGKPYKSNTNTKIQLQAGQYTAELQRTGYNSWRRIITIAGGSLQHFDYPKLFPTKIIPTTIKDYLQAPGFASQSPDRRWLLVQPAATPQVFDLFDLSDPKKVTTNATTITIPDTVFGSAKAGTQSWKLVEWSTDNRHVLLQYTYTPDTASDSDPSTASTQMSDYIMLDRQVPADSVNLTKTLGLTATKELSLFNKKYDSYYVYDSADQTLGTTSIADAGKVTPLLDDVLDYKSYGANMMLYITTRDPTTDKLTPVGTVLSVLYDNGQSYKLRSQSATGPFLIDLAEYNGNWFMAVGSNGDNKVYIYENPETILKSSDTAVLVPIEILHVTSPDELAFSSSTQLVMIEHGTAFADYDLLYGKGYDFIAQYPLDAPATHATWMDDHRLAYISDGKLVVFDYDNINADTLVPASSDYLPFFDRNYDYVYTLAPTATGGMALTSSSLLTPADQ